MAKQQNSGLKIAQKQRGVLVTNLMVAEALQKSDSDILEEIQQQLDENPLVERKEPTESEVHRNEGSDYDDDPDDRLYDAPTAVERQYYRTFGGNGYGDDERSPQIAAEQSLEEHLLEQMGQLNLNATQRVIAENIIGNLDSNGWLVRLTSAIADDVTFNDGVEVEKDDVEEVLHLIQTQLDPPGIACRTLEECMLLQLDRFEPSETVGLAQTLIKEHIDELALHHFDRLCDLLDIDKAQLAEVVREIQRTNPRPGNAYSSEMSKERQYQITPEFEVEVDGDTITCSLVNNLDVLCISKEYDGTALVKNDATLKKRYEEARTYIEVLKHRQEKLFAVMESIVKHQREFFLSGGDEVQLRPLTYRVIEEDTGIDKSTISRICSSKYVFTPWGVCRLKDFFSSVIEDAEGKEISNKAVKTALQAIVDAEDKRQPLTDDAIRLLLEQQGYRISRRTVAKYRDQLGIDDRPRRKQI